MEKIKAIQNVKIPTIAGKEHINIQSGIINNNIPFLFSNSSMKKTQMKINFQNDTINAFGENIPLISTTSGHYAILLTQAKQFMNNIDRGSTTRVNLMITKNKSNKAMALILHHQFAHPTPDKLINVITNAGISWSNNNELRKEMQKSQRTVLYAKCTGKYH